MQLRHEWRDGRAVLKRVGQVRDLLIECSQFSLQGADVRGDGLRLQFLEDRVDERPHDGGSQHICREFGLHGTVDPFNGQHERIIADGLAALGVRQTAVKERPLPLSKNFVQPLVDGE